MVGGTVIEVAEVKDRSDVLYVDTADMPEGRRKPDTCAIFIQRTETSEKIEVGDALWWQGDWAYWTPKANRKPSCGYRHHVSCQRAGVDYDIKIRRIGFSGVAHPSRLPQHESD